MIWIELLRPFTLLPPLLGMWSGAAGAYGSGAMASLSPWEILWYLLLGSLSATLLNGASNVLNQIYDLDIDRINKPERPIPSGRVGRVAAGRYCAALYAVSIGVSFGIQPAGRPEVFWIVVLTAFLTWIYSAPPVRARKHWWLAPLVIAIPRGGLLKVAGWGMLAPTFSDSEPWLLGAVFFLFILGAASTKDFSDLRGDRACGVVTLPVRFGCRQASRLMAPFYVLPWLMVLGVLLPFRFLRVEPTAGYAFAAFMLLASLWVARHLVLSGERLMERHIGEAAWKRLYGLMMVAQVGFAVLYLAFGLR
ncbi:MAG TPA: UbiA family prenyltransferase [Planctomycetota bacterium]|nr:UbiA family prenyltransferase [Planctomycetota bacterium]